MLRKTGLDKEAPDQNDRRGWPALRARLAEIFRAKTRDEWCALMEGSDVCFAPVLTLPEALEHPHNRARGVFVEVAGVKQPAPAPRFSRTKPDVPRPPESAATVPVDALGEWGFSAAEVADLAADGAFGAEAAN
jgi:alpha-methylacyl-CoA racemase